MRQKPLTRIGENGKDICCGNFLDISSNYQRYDLLSNLLGFYYMADYDKDP